MQLQRELPYSRVIRDAHAGENEDGLPEAHTLHSSQVVTGCEWSASQHSTLTSQHTPVDGKFRQDFSVKKLAHPPFCRARSQAAVYKAQSAKLNPPPLSPLLLQPSILGLLACTGSPVVWWPASS